jgi:hypothetical protein
VDHFTSNINLGHLIGQIPDFLHLNGSTLLNREAAQFSPSRAKTLSDSTAGDSHEDLIFLAHSQGTNNLAWTLLHLAQHFPGFFDNRIVRCAFFDPKLGRNYMEHLFGLFPQDKVRFLFFQSQNDLLGNQGVGVPKFISEFPHGDHIWVKGLNHGSIREWASLNKKQSWLDQSGYQVFQRAQGKKIIALRRQNTRTGQLGTTQMQQLKRWTDQYARDHMNQDKLSEALMGFLTDKLPDRFHP